MTSKAKKEKIKRLIKNINENNISVSASPERLKEVYTSLKIKKLNDLRKEQYKTYKEFSKNDGDTLYIVVHPAYYTFFDMKPLTLSSGRDTKEFPQKNIVERLYEQSSFLNFPLRVMQEQERTLRDFIETSSTEEKLMLFVLPRNYPEHFSYGNMNGLDEYARYINETTNMSESVIFIESVDWNRGRMAEEEARMVAEFIKELDIKKVYIGGGYICRCLDGFYTSLVEAVGYEKLYIVPEITAISPFDISEDTHSSLLSERGHINVTEVRRFMLSPCVYLDPFPEIKNLVPNIRHFYVHEFTD